jgi:hypothetical protein
MKKHMMLVAAFVSAATMLAACGSDDPPPPATGLAPAQATVPVNSAVAGASKDVPFEFDGGVPELGTTGVTSVMFTSTATNPGFRIAAGGSVATGTTAFGSCIFRIADSTFPAGHRLAPGTEISVSPCDLTIILENMPANGETQSKPAQMKLGATVSRPARVLVAVAPNGTLLLAGVPIGIVTVTPATGGSSP